MPAVIRPIEQDELDDFMRIVGNAYPVFEMNSREELERTRNRIQKQNEDPRYSLWGYYDGDALLGGIRLHDWTVTLRGAQLACGGGGLLAVDLCHKKEHIARDLMRFFFRRCRDEKRAPMAMLWPFRPDFYRLMGVGYGAKIHRYRIRPQDLPAGGSREHVREMGPDDAADIAACYNRFASRINGMVRDTELHRRLRLEQATRLRTVGYMADGRLTGFLLFGFSIKESPNPLNNNLQVLEFVYETPEAFAGLVGFLRTQADQINRIVIDTTDDDFHHLPSDPRNDSDHAYLSPVLHESHTSGVGIMYRVLDVNLLFEQLADHAFGYVDLDLTINVRDTFLKRNDGPHTVLFRNGFPRLSQQARPSLVVAMDIADFSSLVMGAVSFGSLITYGRAHISNPAHIEDVNRLFATDRRPTTLTPF